MNRRGLAVATVAAAALALTVSATVDTGAVAAAGKSLVLGQDNRVKGTTTLASKGRGPALRLRSRDQVPALAVSNSQLIKQLNADLLDGRSAEELAPVTTRFVVARPGDSLEPHKLLSVTLPPGSYLMTGSGALFTNEAGLFWQCFVATPNGIRLGGQNGLLAADTGRGSGGWSLSDVVTVTTEPLVVGCTVEGDEHEVFTPVVFTFRRVADVVTGQGQPFVP
jgi:hypothetical protein